MKYDFGEFSYKCDHPRPALGEICSECTGTSHFAAIHFVSFQAEGATHPKESLLAAKLAVDDGACKCSSAVFSQHFSLMVN